MKVTIPQPFTYTPDIRIPLKLLKNETKCYLLSNHKVTKLQVNTHQVLCSCKTCGNYWLEYKK